MDQELVTTPHEKILPAGVAVANQPWGPEEKAEAIEMFNSKKYSMGAIADKFNRSRNAVAGLLHRHRQAEGFTTPKASGRPRKADKRIPTTVVSVPFIRMATRKPPKKQRIRLRLIENETAVTFKELEPHMCKWPLGDPRQSDFRFCGCTRRGSGPYCAEHTVIAGRLYARDA